MQGLSQFISLAFKLALLYTILVTGIDLIFVQARDLFFAYAKSGDHVYPCLHDRDKYPKENA